ncbi:AraC family transcriptional regulator [Oscillatoria sp. CS-180]|uniref:helix-turn-helix domain-containing protein n=1 Tax=Oscillatoria sp. CS-180 TaxID=3021720 RepID=UPI00232FEF6B|nr:AraC family transcriptional regulator [Oscillatoria sp. CS-180]MDB9527576.1 AraC family transcriptional regulator [Oscillatoria sp. CS-180]
MYPAKYGDPYLIQQLGWAGVAIVEGKEGTIAEIALQYGFNSQNHFSKHFKDAISTTPMTDYVCEI